MLTPPYQANVFRVPPKDFHPKVHVAGCYIRFGENYLFLHRSLKTTQGNTWGVPGGGVEQGETPFQAALREVYEETGIDLRENLVEDVGSVCVRYPHMDFVYHMFMHECSSCPPVELSDEHQEYRWVSLQEAVEMPLISGGRETLYHFRALAKKSKILRKEFYFIRHGETDANVYPSRKQIEDTLPLNANGRNQVFSIRPHVANIPLQSVCFSPMERARETKEILAEGMELNHLELQDLRECDSDMWMKMVRLERGSRFCVCPEIEQFFSRVMRGVSTALEMRDPTLIVAHGGVHWALCYQMRVENHPWKIRNSELVHFYPVGDTEWKAEKVSA